ncbi:hypothetical protein [uncultured Tenacibaculum sp.]|uniref:hypothetical protein n=1 Tax=uncultured Tenacibaculum sp. TaxID=174713 RepID=UPI0026374819|nr:hypothetical protein [uncultured Tenacibaculum sp.]
MIKNKQTRKTIAIFFLLNFLSAVFPYNELYAQTTGPNAPEAASFEPVDATDMVNLLTGGFSYVLPVLNVPSPEGGYPLALSYHAGIGMDQEASWVGLGWNLNPGAINRNVNGMPDDAFYTKNSEYFYSSEESITEYQASLGYSGYGFSVATGVSWGSNRSLGGFVSAGIGIELGGYTLGVGASAGNGGVGVNAGLSTPSGLSFGVSASTNGGVSGSVGYASENGTGFDISTSGSFGVSLGFGEKSSGNISTVGIDFSSSGVGVTVRSTDYKENGKGEDGKMTYKATGSTGTGMNTVMAFNNTVKMGDYTTSTSSLVIPITIPTPIGIFSFSFGKQTFKYSLNKFEENYMTGPVNYNRIGGYLVSVRSDEKVVINCNYCTPGGSYVWSNVGSLPYSYTQMELDKLVNGKVYKLTRLNRRTSMDINELAVSSTGFSNNRDVFSASPNFPNYDKYNVQAQGLSGAIAPTVFENGALYGFSEKTSSDNKNLSYVINDENNVPAKFRFNKKVEFNFKNEISTYLSTPKPSLDLSVFSNTLNTNGFTTGVSKRKTANFIQYYTHNEIVKDKDRVRSEGYLDPVGYTRPFIPNSNFYEAAQFFSSLYGKIPSESIGAFKITGIDGKTYHYAIPVYNHDIIQRTYGTMKYQDGRTGIKPESEAYFEKKQLEPYATHWLLTTVTGPDFVDTNNNGVADKEDYGYWVNFEYGKYSNAYVWSAPYGKELIENEKDPNIKTWIKGRKEIYYLDKVLTRTHTAYFVKSERKDAKSKEFNYKTSIGKYNNAGNLSGMDYESNYIIPEQKLLKLDKIILTKNKKPDGTLDLSFTKQRGGKKELDIEYKKPGNMYYNGLVKVSKLYFDDKSSVVDTSDDFTLLKDRIVKVVELDNNHYDLAIGTPNSEGGGRLTLKGVKFKGKLDSNTIPPYSFSYINPYYNFNIDDKDHFGYYSKDNSIWSLNEITTPQGSKIKVDYESHKIKSAINSKITLSKSDKEYKIYGDYDGSNSNAGAQPRAFIVETTKDIGIKIGSKLNISYHYSCFIEEDPQGCSGYCGHDEYACIYNGEGVVTQKLADNKYFVLPDNANWECDTDRGGSSNPTQWRCDYSNVHLSAEYILKDPITEGGIRVKRVSTVSESGKYYNMNYNYGENGNGVGHVTYLPYAPELAKELPYSSELPPPIPMYEYVSTTTSTGNNSTENNIYGIKTDYRFNVLKSKEEGKAKFGNFYELTSNQTNGTSSSTTQLHDFTIKDNLSAIGQLLSVKSYSEEGQILSSIENEYYSPGETPDKLGETKESYQTYKKITEGSSSKNLGVSSSRITYPNLIKSSTELKGGYSYTSEFNDLDEITGQAREVYSYSSTGLKYKNRSEQAYLKYPKMGSKVDDITNKNMLSQSAVTYNYIYKNNDWKPIGIGITTWKNSWNYKFNNNSIVSTNDVWRKHKTFVWKGELNEDGTYKNFVDNFDWSINANQNSSWAETTHVTKYNQFSQVIEIKDINNNYISTKYGDNYTKVIATANANYDEMYYCGAEDRDYAKIPIFGGAAHVLGEGDFFDGGVKATGHKKVTNKKDAHTGTGIVEVAQEVKAFEVIVPARSERNSTLKQQFKISVWVKKGQEANLKINVGNSEDSFNNSEDIQAGNWVLKQGYITIPSIETTVSIESTNGTVQLDDFRLHPIASNMTSYVYNEWDELSFITNPNGLSKCYVYDEAGRIKETWVEVITNTLSGIDGGFVKVSINSYNYKKNQ